MKKIFFFISVFFLSFNIKAQNSQVSDINTPELSSFSLNGDSSPQGAIANSVKEVNGKLNTSIPVTSVTARTLSYPVTLTYNGDNVFKQAQYLNQYEPQSTLGVGWSLSTPKIIADNKGTATREDDTYYLLSDGKPNKLTCTNHVEPTGSPVPTGSSYRDFETESYLPFKIRYKINYKDFNFGNYTTIVHDYWEIIDDKGVTYIYGDTDNTRENVIAWGNWIGDSKNIVGTSEHTIAWNLAKIQDQWSNNITFLYEKVQRGINTSGPKHTEASYVSEIKASIGGKVTFHYDEKSPLEYYEPHKEQSEPDAYQERYETKFLNSIKTYNRDNSLLYVYNTMYGVVSKSGNGDKNRYLASIEQNDPNGNVLPSQEFEYHTSGDFEGGLRKITYPTGGSIIYNYEKKAIFNSSNPIITPIGNITSGYTEQASFTGEDYAIKLMSFGNFTHTGRASHNFKILSDYWVGQKWERTEFIIPEQLGVEIESTGSSTHSVNIDDFRFVSGHNFYAFLTFSREADTGSLYLFHKEKNGVKWNVSQFRNLPMRSWKYSTPDEDPVLLVGDDFVAIGENKTYEGRLYTYVWNGNDWNSKLILQGHGQYYYGAANNFIISLDEDGHASDMVTGATNHPDNYYIHYLDAEKKWQTKSWSSTIFNNHPYVLGTSKPSSLYPSNSMLGFVAHNNPEYIIRWDKYYNVIAVDDNVFGSSDDTYPLLPVGNNNFSLYKPDIHSNSPARHEKSAFFNGSTWVANTFSNNYGQGSGKNNILMGKYSSLSDTHWWYKYNPNTHSWSSSPLSSYGSATILRESFSLSKDFILAGFNSYRISNTGSLNSLGNVLPGTSYGSIAWNTSITNGNEIFVEYRPDYHNIGSSQYTNSFLLDINERNNTLNKQLIASGNANASVILNTTNSSAKHLGGTIPILSGKIINIGGSLKRIIDGAINKMIEDIVISSIEIDNKKDEVRKMHYTYNNPYALPNDKSVFYKEVIVENKGYGLGNVGQIYKYFNTGGEDVQMTGLPTIVIVKDNNGIEKSYTETFWEKRNKTYFNSENQSIDTGYYIVPIKEIEKLTLEGKEIITETNNFYNSRGMLTRTNKENSNGDVESVLITYPFENNEYSFVKNRNMLNFPYETKSLVAGEVVSVEQSLWKNGSKIYAYQNKSGVDVAHLRVNNEITKTDNYSNIQESNNGMGIYKTVLYGHNNLYPIAIISNAKYTEVVNQLDVSYASLQHLSNTALLTELKKLYNRLPEAMINLNIYDNQGKVIKTLDERQEAINFIYDSFGRLEFTTDANNKVIVKKVYNYGS